MSRGYADEDGDWTPDAEDAYQCGRREDRALADPRDARRRNPVDDDVATLPGWQPWSQSSKEQPR